MTDCTNNFLAPSGFRVVIDRKNYGSLTMMAQQVVHPQITMQAVELPYRRTAIALAGDNLQFSEVSFDFLMDENMVGYSEVYDWMERSVEQKHKLKSDRDEVSFYADVEVFVLTSSLNVNKSIKYINCTPTTLGTVTFASTGDTTYITFPVTFAFDYFTVS